jgi:DNA-binding transcriptional MerR regulator
MTEVAEEKRLYKIGEVCRVADVQPYVLRYWETEFAALAPNKSGGGQRLYTQREIDIILRIKQLLYSEGFTIAGAKKKLEAELVGGVVPAPSDGAPPSAQVPRSARDDTKAKQVLLEVKRELTAILDLLNG